MATTEELLNPQSSYYTENPYYLRPGETPEQYQTRTGALSSSGTNTGTNPPAVKTPSQDPIKETVGVLGAVPPPTPPPPNNQGQSPISYKVTVNPDGSVFATKYQNGQGFNVSPQETEQLTAATGKNAGQYTLDQNFKVTQAPPPPISSQDTAYNQAISDYNKTLTEYSNVANTWADDPLLQSYIRGIETTLNESIKEQETTNRAYLAGVEQSGIRGGRQRYAQDLYSSEVATEASAGLARISKLRNAANQMILDAQISFRDKAYEKAYNKVLQYKGLVETTRQAALDEAKRIQDIADKSMAEQKANREALQQTLDYNQDLADSLAQDFILSLSDDEDSDTEKLGKFLEDMKIKYPDLDESILRGAIQEQLTKEAGWSNPYEMPGIGTVQSNLKTGEIRTLKPTTQVTGGKPRISFQTINGQVTQIIQDEQGNIISTTPLGAGGAGGGLEATKTRENANSGLRAISTIRQELYNTDGSIKRDVLVQAAIPGSLFARTYETAVNEAADVLTRLRTGAALNENEERFYREKLPTLFDLSDEGTIEYKLSLLESLFTALSKYGMMENTNIQPSMNLGGGSTNTGSTTSTDFRNKYNY